MARNQLINNLKSEALHYIGIPYWKNKLLAGKVIKEGYLGGKGTSQDIAIKTITTIQKQKKDVLSMSSQDIYNIQKKNNIGIDCSGLCYNLINFYYKQLHNEDIEDKIIGVNGKKGIRKVSANKLTSDDNSIKIENYDDIKTGDLIRVDNGKHVIFIIEKLDNTISYIHSSDMTYTRGVHFGSIEIIDKSKPLENQIWSDKTKDGKDYSIKFNSNNGDGVFRLKILA